jgi:hypothetical protein
LFVYSSVLFVFIRLSNQPPPSTSSFLIPLISLIFHSNRLIGISNRMLFPCPRVRPFYQPPHFHFTIFISLIFTHHFILLIFSFHSLIFFNLPFHSLIFFNLPFLISSIRFHSLIFFSHSSLSLVQISPSEPSRLWLDVSRRFPCGAPPSA